MAETHNHLSGKGNIFLALALGAAAGAIGGLLFAPRAGKETRKKVKQWGEDLAEKSRDLRHNVQMFAHKTWAKNGSVGHPISRS